MNTRIVAVAALAFAAAGSAFAQEATYELPQPAVSQTTRAAVLAELTQAREQGFRIVGEAGWPVQPTMTASSLTRAEVMAAARAAQADPAWQGITGESNAFDIAVAPAGAQPRVAMAR